MKLLSLLLAAVAMVATSIAQEESRELATLAQTWNISEPTFTYSSLSFDLDYVVSGFILDSMAGYSMWDTGCKEGGNTVPSTELAVVKSLDPSWTTQNANLQRTIALNITVNPSTISKAPIYKEGKNGANQTIANISFCVRFSLDTPPSVTPTIEVNFLETLVTLNVDLTNGFSIGSINVAPKQKLTKTANQAYHVEGYQCDATDAQLTPTQIAATRNQGSVIRVCVRPDQTGRNDGIFMRSIDSFSFVRDTTVTQDAVVNGAAASNGLTSLDCGAGYAICSFETILFAAFYTSAGTVAGSGVASMQFGGSARRLRNGGRDLQAGQAAATSEFNLDFQTLPSTDTQSSDAATTSGVLAMTLLAMSGALVMV